MAAAGLLAVLPTRTPAHTRRPKYRSSQTQAVQVSENVCEIKYLTCRNLTESHHRWPPRLQATHVAGDPLMALWRPAPWLCDPIRGQSHGIVGC